MKPSLRPNSRILYRISLFYIYLIKLFCFFFVASASDYFLIGLFYVVCVFHSLGIYILFKIYSSARFNFVAYCFTLCYLVFHVNVLDWICRFNELLIETLEGSPKKKIENN